jgi:hypothetical protein
MNEENKKYYFGLLKRYGIVIGSSLLLTCGVKYCKSKNNKNIEGIFDNSEIIVDSLKNFNDYSIKFKN